MRPVITALGLVAMAAAAVWSVQLARADESVREGRAEGVARAIDLLPGNTAYLAFAVLQAEQGGRDATAFLQRIVELNPTLAEPRIRLGRLAEQHGDSAGAEKWLQAAFAVDKQFEPRWELANFYQRQGRTDEFWTWMRSALELSYGDRSAAFDLCWQVSGDPREILQRAIPEHGPVRDAYLHYVLNTHRGEAIAGATRGAEGQSLRLAAADALLDARRYAEAVEVWKSMGFEVPVGVTRPRFEGTGSGLGFDWRFFSSDGVTHQQLDGGRGHRVRLSGKQPEEAVLLSQYLGGLTAGERYRLSAKVDAGPDGLEWRVAGQPVGGEFTAPGEVALLQLWYVRPRGSVRAEASFDITEVLVSALH